MAPFRFPRFPNRTPGKRAFRTSLAAAAWVLVTVAAVTVGVLVSGALNAQNGLRPLNAAEVAQSLADRNNRMASEAARRSDPAPAPSTSATAPAPLPASTPPTATSVLRSSGGTVLASCSAGVAQIVSSTAAQGFSIDEDAKPGSPKLSFESESVKLNVEVLCTGDLPRLQETAQPKTPHRDQGSDS